MFAAAASPPPPSTASTRNFRHPPPSRDLDLLLLLIGAALAALSAAVIYIVLQYRSPIYTVTEFAARGMNLTSPAPISPQFDVTVGVLNPNRKIGIHYLKESFVKVYCGGEILGLGVLPHFYQPGESATSVRATAGSFAVLLDGAVKTELSSAQRCGRVPLVLTVEAPVKFKWFVNTREFTAKAKCDVVLDELSDKAQIVSQRCDTDLHFPA
ncbi:NDR1/HIN1-like protein 13 [Salvia hispanica]|uniref:NDR1/HIN1-like protein 13 n=1 Tax=Salvia hispanica TaxID=49212 RepID=UPI0020097161|nr:NDR1/HIN1-like protein 13 [Salvia hispanica]